MRDKLQDEKAYIEVLGLFAELFLVACIVTPTFAVVLIAMVALQGTMGHQQQVTIVLGLTFLLIPHEATTATKQIKAVNKTMLTLILSIPTK